MQISTMESRSIFGLSALAIFALMVGGVPIATAAEPPLGPGDVLKVRAVHQPEVAGDYNVQPSGEISLPLVGRIAVEGRLPSDVEKAVTDALITAEISTRPEISVEVERYRDIYVMGSVANPGAYPWRPGLSVRAAMALAGGRVVVPGDEIGLALQAIRAEEYYVSLTYRIAALEVRRARVEAETAAVAAGALESEVEIEPVDWAEVPAVVDKAGLKEAQAGLLENNIAVGRATMTSLKARKEALIARLYALRRRHEKLEEEEALVAEQVQTIEGLTESGLARRPQLLDIQQRLLQTASTQLEVLADIAEAESALADNAVKLSSHVNERLAALSIEETQVLSELLEARSRLDPARRADEVAAGYAPASVEEPEILSIVRERSDAPQPLPAAVGDAVWPGDTLVVPPLMAEDPPVASAADPQNLSPER